MAIFKRFVDYVRLAILAVFGVRHHHCESITMYSRPNILSRCAA